MYDEIVLLICPENPNFHLQNVKMQETKVFNTIKEKKSDPALFGTHETSVTAERIIITSFKIKYARAFVDYQCSKLGYDRAAPVSKRKRKMGKEQFYSLRKTLKVLESGGSFPKHN